MEAVDRRDPERRRQNGLRARDEGRGGAFAISGVEEQREELADRAVPRIGLRQDDPRRDRHAQRRAPVSGGELQPSNASPAEGHVHEPQPPLAAAALAAPELERLEATADPNLIPLGARAGIKGGMAGAASSRAAFVLDEIPEAEWWDVHILKNGTYDDISDGKWEIKPEKINLYVEHPVPMQPPLCQLKLSDDQASQSVRLMIASPGSAPPSTSQEMKSRVEATPGNTSMYLHAMAEGRRASHARHERRICCCFLTKSENGEGGLHDPFDRADLGG